MIIEDTLTNDEMVKAVVDAVCNKLSVSGKANCRVEFTSVQGVGVTAKVRIEFDDAKDAR